MIIRNGFVSNSSSSSFMITNKTDKDLDFITFLAENGEELIKDCIKRHSWLDKDEFNFKYIMSLIAEEDERILVGSDEYEFYDDYEYGSILSMLLDGSGESKSFKWEVI